MTAERVWLTHPDLPTSAFHCPAAAVAGWKVKGWVEGEAPTPINPALVERPAPAVVPAPDVSTPVDDGAQQPDPGPKRGASSTKGSE